MDINDEMMMMEFLMQDEADAASDQEQRMMVLTYLLHYHCRLALWWLEGWEGAKQEGKTLLSNIISLSTALSW
jgi:hypothetical protein